MAGPDHVELERAFGRWAGADNVVACSSGTAALHLAMEAFDLPAGSDVIVPDYAMIACARAVVLAGLTPVFADCRREDLTVDPAAVESLITSRTRAVMVVHNYGRAAATGAVADLCKKHDLYLIEDLAEAHGVPPHPDADAACWSFYANKIVYGEEGGAVAFKEASAAREARQLRCLGFDDGHDYWHRPRGHNYRMSPSHARLVLGCLGRVRDEVARRARHVALYDAACPARFRRPPRDADWVYDVRVPGLTPLRQRLLVAELKKLGAPARHGFKPLRLQPEFSGAGLADVRAYDADPPRWESDAAGREVLYFGIGQSNPDLVTGSGAAKIALDLVSRYADGGAG